MIKLFLNIFSLTMLVLISCTLQPPVASGGTGSETVVGKVFTPTGEPARNALYHLRRWDYLSPLIGTNADEENYVDGRTDDSGRFIIDNVAVGTYKIEVNNDSSAAVLFNCIIDGLSDTVDLGSKQLQLFSVIEGQVDTTGITGMNLFARIAGMERLAMVAGDGRFILTRLPQGTFDIHIAGTDSADRFVTSNVRTNAGDTVAISVAGGWRFSKKLYINTTATGADIFDDVYNFPLLVRLDSVNFDFSETNQTGQDIRFSKTDGTLLSYEIEQFNQTDRSAAIWVKVDTIFGNTLDQSITLLWGNQAVTDQSDGAAVFDVKNGFTGVWHLSEASTTVRKDATVYHNDGQAVGYESDESTDGRISKGDSLDNTDDAIMVGDSTITNTLTLSMWIYMTINNPWAHLFAKPYSPQDVKPWMVYGLQIDSSNTPHCTFTISTETGSIWAQSSSVVPLKQWVYITGTYDGSSLRIYYNGIQEGSAPISGALILNNEKLCIGALDAIDAAQRFCGKIDEVRISDRPRSQAWVKLCYESQMPGSSVVETGE